MSSFSIQIAWSILFIALCWPTQIVDAAERRSTRSEITQAVKCLKPVIRNDSSSEWLNNELKFEEYANYIEDFCKDINPSNVKEKMAERTRGQKKVAKRVKKCLYDSEHRRIYDHYYTFDQIESNDRKENPTSPSVQPEEGKLDDMAQESDNESISTDDDKEDHNEEHSDSEEILRISKFVLGMCFRDKFLNLDELKDEDQKQDAIQCLKGCEIIFLRNILNDIDYAIHGEDAIEGILMQKGVIDESFDKDKLTKDENPDLFQFIKELKATNDEEEKLGREFNHSENHDLQMMKDTGVKFLENYSEQYTITREYLTKIDTNYPLIKATYQDKELTSDLLTTTMNDRLGGSFTNYKICAKRECLTKKSSLPLYDYIRDKTKKVENKDTLSGQLTAKTTKIAVNRDATSISGKNIDLKQQFYQALLREDEDDSE